MTEGKRIIKILFYFPFLQFIVQCQEMIGLWQAYFYFSTFQMGFFFSLQFVIGAAIAHCVELATDRQGCCVLQKCLHHSDGDQKNRLVAEIAANSLALSQDQYGYAWTALFNVF